MPKITVPPDPEYAPRGATIDASTGTSLCDALLENGIEHACGKVGACTTCHVIVTQGSESLNPTSDDEDDMLDRAWGLHPRSRLSCKVRIGADDLVVELPKYSINHAKENA
jgi:2Fe-2S ferredoxin